MLSKRDLYKNPISHFKCSISKYRILFLQVHDTRPNFAWFAPSQSVSHKSCSHVKHQVPKLHLHQTPGAQSAQCQWWSVLSWYHTLTLATCETTTWPQCYTNIVIQSLFEVDVNNYIKCSLILWQLCIFSCWEVLNVLLLTWILKR